MTQCVIYVRFSSPRQERGDSRERQLERCRNHASSKGWNVVEIVEDLGRSAWSGDHLKTGELGKFAQRSAAGFYEPNTVLVVEKLDRLSRQGPMPALGWMGDRCREGMRIGVVDGDKLYDDGLLKNDLISIIEVLLKGKLANDESEQKSDRVSAAKRRAFDKAADGGAKITAKGPGWLSLSEDRGAWRTIPERVSVVVQIYQWAAIGMGPRLIAKKLTDAKIPTFQEKTRKRLGDGWETSTVKLILRQPSVEGDYVRGFANTKPGAERGERIVGYYPRIVSADLVERARAALDGRRISGRHRAEAANLFTGLAFCGACGSRLHMRKASTPMRPWLQCASSLGARGCRVKAMYRYDLFESAILDHLLALAMDDSYFAARPADTLAAANELALARKAVDDKHAEIDTITNLLIDTPSATLKARLIKAEAGVTGLSAKVEDAERQLAAARGAVDAQAHRLRVSGMRVALTHRDPTIRQEARLRAQAAFGQTITHIEAEVEEDGTKVIHVIVAGGLALKFVEGSLISQAVILDHPEVAATIASNARLRRQLGSVVHRGRALVSKES